MHRIWPLWTTWPCSQRGSWSWPSSRQWSNISADVWVKSPRDFLLKSDTYVSTTKYRACSYPGRLMRICTLPSPKCDPWYRDPLGWKRTLLHTCRSRDLLAKSGSTTLFMPGHWVTFRRLERLWICVSQTEFYFALFWLALSSNRPVHCFLQTPIISFFPG